MQGRAGKSSKTRRARPSKGGARGRVCRGCYPERRDARTGDGAITLQDAARNARARLLAKKIAAKRPGEVRPDPIRRAIDKARCRCPPKGDAAGVNLGCRVFERFTVKAPDFGENMGWTPVGIVIGIGAALGLLIFLVDLVAIPSRHPMPSPPSPPPAPPSRQTSSKSRARNHSRRRSFCLLRHPRPSHHRPRLPSNRLRFLRSA